MSQTTTKTDTLLDPYKEGSGILVFGSGVPVSPLFFFWIDDFVPQSKAFMRLILIQKQNFYSILPTEEKGYDFIVLNS